MSNDLVRVRIISETHYDQGKLVPKGTVVENLSPRTAEHLVQLGAAEIVTAPKLTKAPTGGDE